MYTVMVAAMDRRVVAGDPILSNLALVNSSLRLAGRSHLVSFINNPISDTVATLYPVTIHRANEGHTKLLPAPLLTPALQAAISGEAVTSVTLDQLISFTRAKTVIIKLDIEVSSPVVMAMAQTTLFFRFCLFLLHRIEYSGFCAYFGAPGDYILYIC